MNLRQLWTGWPTRDMDGLFKWYYLVQFAFWLQQIIVVNIEERRKDHWQMFTHHIITCVLIFGSYGYHWYKVGNVILCLMDVVDIFLPVCPTNSLLRWCLLNSSFPIARQDPEIPQIPRGL
jgi:very-long-chain ceramide synthase